MKSKHIHLSEDQLIRFLTDEKESGDHLSACPECQGKKQQFEKELDKLGQMAKAFAPSPQYDTVFLKKTGFSEKTVYHPFRRSVFAAGFVIVLLVTGIWWSVQNDISSEPQLAGIISEMEKDQKLMSEIYEMGEYAPPDLYLEISGESYGYFNDEFLEFVAPLGEDGNTGPVGLIHAFCFTGQI